MKRRNLALLVAFFVFTLLFALSSPAQATSKKLVGFDCNAHESYTVIYEVENLPGDAGSFTGTIIHQHTSKEDAVEDDIDYVWWEIFASAITPSWLQLIIEPNPENAVDVTYDVLQEIAMEVAEHIAEGLEVSVSELLGPITTIIEIAEGVWEAESAKSSDGGYDFWVFDGTLNTAVGKINWTLAAFISDEWWDSPVVIEERYWGVDPKILGEFQPPRYFYRTYTNDFRSLPKKLKTRLTGIDLYPIEIYFEKDGERLNSNQLRAGDVVEVYAVYANEGCKPVDFAQMHGYFGGDTYIPGKKHITGVEYLGGYNIFSGLPLKPMGIYPVLLNDEYTISGIDERLTPKKHEVCLKTDTDGIIAEYNESNNLLCINVTVHPPLFTDLLVKKGDIEIYPAIFSPSDKISVTFFVENIGSEKSNKTKIKFEYGDYIVYHWLNELSPGGMQKFTETFYAAEEDKAYIYLDVLDENYEMNEANNIVEIPIKAAPDVKVVDVYTEGNASVINETQLVAKIELSTWKIDGSIYVSFFDNDTIIGMTNASMVNISNKLYPSDIPKNNTFWFNVSWKPKTAGIHKIKVVVDSPNLIEERNEENNELEKEIGVMGERHGVEILCALPYCISSAPAGGTAYFSFGVRNYGDVSEKVYMNYNVYENFKILPSEITITPEEFEIPLGTYKSIDITLEIPEALAEGEYIFNVSANCEGRNCSDEKIMKVGVYNNYRIDIAPMCGDRICLTKSELTQFTQRKVEPDEEIILPFNITNRGHEIGLSFYLHGQYKDMGFSKDSQGGCWGHKYCNSLTVPELVPLKEGESQRVEVKINTERMDAGGYNYTFNVHGPLGKLVEYKFKVSVKPSYDFEVYVISENKINPFTSWQPLYELEIISKANAPMTIIPETISSPENWTLGFYPQKLSLKPLETETYLEWKGELEIGAFFEKWPVKNEPLPAKDYEIEIALKAGPNEEKAKAGEFVKELKFKPKVQAVHNILLSTWDEKEVPRAKVPLTFYIWNKGNVDERVIVKTFSDLSIEPQEQVIYVRPYSYNAQQPGIAYGTVYVDAKDLVLKEEIRLIAEVENCTEPGCRAEAKIIIRAKPDFILSCEGRDFCSHTVSSGGETEYKIRAANGLLTPVNVELEKAKDENCTGQGWKSELSESQFYLALGEEKDLYLVVQAPNKSTGRCDIGIATNINNTKYQIKASTIIDYTEILLYPGWNLVPMPRRISIRETVEEEEEWKRIILICSSDAECDDGDACTRDTCLNPGTANAKCVHTPITKCIDDDGCCPTACNALNDNDCKAKCDDGVCESGENKCTCPEDCGECEGKCSDLPCWEWQCIDEECKCELQENCCGNHICEEGEYYLNCETYEVRIYCPEDCCDLLVPHPPDVPCECPPETQKIIINEETGEFTCECPP